MPHRAGDFSFCKLHRFIKERKAVLFDVALLILFIVALVRRIVENYFAAFSSGHRFF
jgi:hypothetical protein